MLGKHQGAVPLLLSAIPLLIACALTVAAQDETPKIEVGGQLSVIRLRDPFFRSGRLSTEETYTVEPGLGARLIYNLSRNLSLESEINFFPRNTDEFRGGRKLQGLFGLKAGKRWNGHGIFGKIRPGLVRYDREDVIIPTPSTSFALDVGGVFELYPTTRTVLRFDLGDTIIRRNVVDRTPSPPGPSFVTSNRENMHNLQFSVGIGFRF